MGKVKYQLVEGKEPELSLKIEEEINNLISINPILLNGDWVVFYEYHGEDKHLINLDGYFKKGEELEVAKLVYQVFSKYKNDGVLK